MTENVPTIQEIQVLESMAKTAAKTTFFNQYTFEEVLMLFYVARDLGLPRSVVLSKGLTIIKGSVEISARSMNMLIRKHGHELKIVKCNDAGCAIWGKRKDTQEEMEVVYTVEDARKAHLIRSGGGWEKNPSDMCFARAISRLARRLFPDCIGNCYIEGEIAERASKEVIGPPDLKDVQLEIKACDEEKFPLPPWVKEQHLEAYFQEVADTFDKEKSYVKKRALQDLDKFWETFKTWEAQNYGVEKINFPPLEEESALSSFVQKADDYQRKRRNLSAFNS